MKYIGYLGIAVLVLTILVGCFYLGVAVNYYLGFPFSGIEATFDQVVDFSLFSMAFMFVLNIVKLALVQTITALKK